MKYVLIAEDESSIRDFVVINLRRNGYEVIEAVNGEDAIKKYDENSDKIDIVILDIMMPYVDGLEVCKYIRDKSKRIGIIMLTARTQEMDKVTGLMVGADDYVTKPFSPSELMARIDAVYRRVSLTVESDIEKNSDNIIAIGEFVLDLRSHTLTKNGENIDLTQMEFQIIEYFFTNPNVALDRSDILKFVWGDSYFGDEKVVDVNIHRLRNKVEEEPSQPKHLTTVWGMGYKWIV
jgi:DNA-binding response OmpR family regulator